MVSSAVGFWWYYRKKRTATQASLGQFTLDPHQMALVNQGKSTPLSGKEWELLLLLKAHANQTLNRETILNQVWGDEGDYIGRTLDVFISKLRKKLEHDPQLKLINIRGVGYKLSVEGNRGKQFWVWVLSLERIKSKVKLYLLHRDYPNTKHL